MIDRRIRAVFRKYKLSGLALISMLGLASVFAVNLAGFLVLLPKPLWGLLDVAFVTSYFMRFSILLALAMLASRYSVYIASQILGLVFRIFVIISLLAKKKGRRLLRIKGSQYAIYVDGIHFRRHENKSKHENHSIEFKSQVKKLFSGNFLKSALGFIYILGYTQGRVNFRIEYFAIPIQLVVVAFVLSALYTTFTGGIILVVLAVIIFFSIPPRPSDVYFDKKHIENGISFYSFLKFKPWTMVNVQKITLLVLTLSFASGVLHHRSLVAETRKINFLGEVTFSGALVVAASSGFIIHSAEGGYQFMPIEGTRIKVLPLD